MVAASKTAIAGLLALSPTIHAAAAAAAPKPYPTAAAAGPPSHPTPVNDRTAAEVIAALNLIPNPEGGYFVESFRDAQLVRAANATTSPSTARAASTAIYYLLEGATGDSLWHRVTDAAEVWHYYAGAPLNLTLSWNDGGAPEVAALGPDVFAGERPQVVVARNQWQSARSLGAWTLVGTTVAPGFTEAGVELADPSWVPLGV
jgi:predicted cupin superfamily sugar epimerase